MRQNFVVNLDQRDGFLCHRYARRRDRSQRMTAVALTLLGLPMAWARIYLGVHFPLDMLGAALVAGFSAWLACRGIRLYLPPLYRLAIAIHRALFGALIKRGWVRK